MSPERGASRLSSHMLVSALCRRVQSEGGFATIIHRGDDAAGAVLIECVDRGQRHILLERATDFEGQEHWRDAGLGANLLGDVYGPWLERRRKSDPDLWVIELDIADAARLAAEIMA
ncbi:MAG: DUF1491 family protein [Sphingopyxis sp.]